MNFGNEKLRRFTEFLDRTAEKNTLLWLPCVFILAVILGTEKLVNALNGLFSRARTSADGVRKPLAMRAGAFVVAAAFAMCIIPDIAEIGAFAEENDVQQEISDNTLDGIDDDIFTNLTVNNSNENSDSDNNTDINTDDENSDNDGTDTDTDNDNSDNDGIDTDTDDENSDNDDTNTDTDDENSDNDDTNTDTDDENSYNKSGSDIAAYAVDGTFNSILNAIESANPNIYATASAYVTMENDSGEYIIPTRALELASGKDIYFNLKSSDERWYTFRFSDYHDYSLTVDTHSDTCGIIISFPKKSDVYGNRAGDFAASRDFSGAVEISARCGSHFRVTCSVLNDNFPDEKISVFDENLDKLKTDYNIYGGYDFSCNVNSNVSDKYIALFADKDVRYIYGRGIALSLRKVTVDRLYNSSWNKPNYGKPNNHYNDYFDGFDDRLYVVDSNGTVGNGDYYESGEYIPLYTLSGISLALRNYIIGSDPHYYDRYIKYEIRNGQRAVIEPSYNHDYTYIHIDGETDSSVVINAMPADVVHNPVVRVDDRGVNDVTVSWNAVKGVKTYYAYWQKITSDGKSELNYSPVTADDGETELSCIISNLDENSSYRIYVLTEIRDGKYKYDNYITVTTKAKPDDGNTNTPDTPDTPNTPDTPDNPSGSDTPSVPEKPPVSSSGNSSSSSPSGSVVIPVGYTYTPRNDRDSKGDMTITLNCNIENISKGTAHISTRKEFLDNSAELHITNSVSAEEAAAQVMRLLGANASYYTVYPFDVSLYDADSGERIELKNNGYITVELPTPKVMRNNPERIKVYHIKDGMPEYVESEIVLDTDGRPVVRFNTKEFSNYMFVSPSYEDVSSAAGAYDGSVPVETAAIPLSNGVTVPNANVPKDIKFSNKKRRYRILRRRKLDDLVFVY